MVIVSTASSAGSHGHRKRIYQPEEWRESAFTIYGEAAVPAHWSGWIPDPAAQRRTVSRGGDGCVPGGLLRGGFHDMSVLVWAQIFSWFREQEGEQLYRPGSGALPAPYHRRPHGADQCCNAAAAG